MEDSLAVRIGKGTALLFASAAIGNVISFFYKVLLARWLQPYNYGIFSIVLMLVGILSIFFAFGMPSAITRYVSSHLAKKGDVNKLYSDSFKMVAAINLAACIVLVLFSGYIATYLLKTSTLTNAVWLIAASVLFYVLSSFLNGVAMGFQKMGYAAAIQLTEKLAKFIFTALLFYLGFGLNGAIFGMVLSSLAMLIVGLFLVKKLKVIFSFAKPDSGFAKSFLSFSFPVFIGGLSGLFLTWTDTFFLSVLRGPIDVGYYNVATPTVWVLSLVITSFASVLFPLFAEYHTKNDHFGLARILERALKYVIYLSLPASAGLFLLAPYIIQLFFGANYISALSAFRILAFGAFFFSINSLLNNYFTGIGKPQLFVKLTLIAAVTNIILNFILINLYGIAGAALATTTSLAIVSVLALRKIRTMHNIKYSPMLKSLIATIIMVALTLVVLRLANLSQIFRIILSILIGISVYSVALWLLKGLDKTDFKLFAEIYNRIRFKRNPNF